jgi:hypothetical protein
VTFQATFRKTAREGPFTERIVFIGQDDRLFGLPIFYACCPDMRAVLSFNLLPKPAKNPFNPWLGYWFDMASNKYLSSLVSRGFAKILYGTLFALIIRNAFVGNRFYIPRAHRFKAISK